MRGTLPSDIRKIHEKYGDVVRLAPDEVSFATPDALNDVLTVRKGQAPFLKNPLWQKPPPGQVFSMVTTPNHADHARMQALLRGAFTEKALQDQEGIIQSYVNLLISRLRETASSGTAVNMVDWFSYVTFDVIGDLGFGEPFDCLRKSAYHPWVSMISDSLIYFSIALATRYYPLVEFITMKLVPKRMKENVHRQHQLAVAKVHRRLNLEKKRQDFMTPVIEMNTDMQQMSLAEIESTFSMLVVVGSETTGTTLSGILNSLIQNPPVMQSLVSEIRNTFKDEEAITLESVRGLPYLNAVISEGLRLCNPIPVGLPRLVPPPGGTVCGHWLPGNVSPTLSPQHPRIAEPAFANPTFWRPDACLRPSIYNL